MVKGRHFICTKKVGEYPCKEAYCSFRFPHQHNGDGKAIISLGAYEGNKIVDHPKGCNFCISVEQVKPKKNKSDEPLRDKIFKCEECDGEFVIDVGNYEYPKMCPWCGNKEIKEKPDGK